tara:strand:- start:22955 stop:23128 length:174 start_codon:yes stop_codon:yes gene_type:complete
MEDVVAKFMIAMWGLPLVFVWFFPEYSPDGFDSTKPLIVLNIWLAADWVVEKIGEKK